MPHLQLVTGDRLFADAAKHEELWIQHGKTYTLEHVGWRSGAATVSSDKPAVVVTVTATAPDRQTFTLTARGIGKAKIMGHSAAGVTPTLTVIAGDFQKHFGKDSVDLLSDVLRGGDPVKMLLIQQMLNNMKDNFFDQEAAHNVHPDHGTLACGIVVKERGNQIFSSKPLKHLPQLGTKGGEDEVVCPIRYEYPIHEPVTQKIRKRTDLKYHSNVIRDFRVKMAKLLRAGTPVRVGVTDRPDRMRWRKPYDPKRKGWDLYAYDAWGHTVLIFGCNASANEFLYMDPWYGGSQLDYKGGAASDLRPATCWSMGIFRSMWEKDRLVPGDKVGNENVLRQTPATEGSFSTAGGNFLEVISGP